MDQPNSAPVRDAGKEHIPRYPRFFIAVRVLQLVLGIVLLGLSGFLVSAIAFTGHALMIFTAIATLLCSVYHLVAWFGPARAFNYWAILATDIFLLIFWLVSFALVALGAATLLASYGYSYSFKKRSPQYYDDYYYYDYDTVSYSDIYLTWGAIAAAAAAFGAIEFVLYIISLTIHGIAVNRHRKAGLHCMPGADAAAAASALNGNNGEKIQMQPQAAPVYQQQQPQQQPPPQGYPTAPGYAQPMYGGPSPVTSQTTGGSYVQGAQVPLDGSTGGGVGYGQQPVQQQPHQELAQYPNQPVYETHGDSRPAGQ